MSFNYSDLEKDERKVVDNSIKTFPKHRKDFEVKAISPEINLLGQTVDEACLNLDKYLDTAALAGLESVRVVHGKGTGALRKGVQEYLSHHPHVKSYRIGMHGEGDAGVTIVILK
jgi:DNA mismatch repair protein MutS2